LGKCQGYNCAAYAVTHNAGAAEAYTFFWYLINKFLLAFVLSIGFLSLIIDKPVLTKPINAGKIGFFICFGFCCFY
jgi:hypothetical protein